MSRAKHVGLLSVSRVAAIFLTLAAASPADAQDLRSAAQTVARRTAIQQVPDLLDAGAHRSRVPSSSSLKPPRQSSVATKASIIALATLGGFVAGGFAGAALENAITPCKCDDPGLRGSMIGAPAGAVVAGVVAFHLTR
jgi:hypothetical protein